MHPHSKQGSKEPRVKLDLKLGKQNSMEHQPETPYFPALPQSPLNLKKSVSRTLLRHGQIPENKLARIQRTMSKGLSFGREPASPKVRELIISSSTSRNRPKITGAWRRLDVNSLHSSPKSQKQDSTAKATVSNTAVYLPGLENRTAEIRNRAAEQLRKIEFDPSSEKLLASLKVGNSSQFGSSSPTRPSVAPFFKGSPAREDPLGVSMIRRPPLPLKEPWKMLSGTARLDLQSSYKIVLYPNEAIQGILDFSPKVGMGSLPAGFRLIFEGPARDAELDFYLEAGEFPTQQQFSFVRSAVREVCLGSDELKYFEIDKAKKEGLKFVVAGVGVCFGQLRMELLKTHARVGRKKQANKKSEAGDGDGEETRGGTIKKNEVEPIDKDSIDYKHFLKSKIWMPERILSKMRLSSAKKSQNRSRFSYVVAEDDRITTKSGYGIDSTIREDDSINNDSKVRPAISVDHIRRQKSVELIKKMRAVSARRQIQDSERISTLLDKIHSSEEKREHNRIVVEYYLEVFKKASIARVWISLIRTVQHIKQLRRRVYITRKMVQWNRKSTAVRRIYKKFARDKLDLQPDTDLTRSIFTTLLIHKFTYSDAYFKCRKAVGTFFKEAVKTVRLRNLVFDQISRFILIQNRWKSHCLIFKGLREVFKTNFNISLELLHTYQIIDIESWRTIKTNLDVADDEFLHSVFKSYFNLKLKDFLSKKAQLLMKKQSILDEKRANSKHVTSERSNSVEKKGNSLSVVAKFTKVAGYTKSLKHTSIVELTLLKIKEEDPRYSTLMKIARILLHKHDSSSKLNAGSLRNRTSKVDTHNPVAREKLNILAGTVGLEQFIAPPIFSKSTSNPAKFKLNVGLFDTLLLTYFLGQLVSAQPGGSGDLESKFQSLLSSPA